MKKIIIFIGKGGVGKTTLAVSISSFFATLKKSVYLVSLDPAHNLFYFMGINSSDSITKVNNYLTVEEFDIDQYIRKYLKHTSETMKNTYRHLSILNLEGMFNVLKHSPGMSEYAVIHALYELIEKWKIRVDYFVIDTPPTGLTLRLFTLPITTLTWLENLKYMRMKILERRGQIRHIKRDDPLWSKIVAEKENDPIFSELASQENMSRSLFKLFQNQAICRIVLVLNYDELSIKEGIRIIRELRDLKVPVSLIVFNKASVEDRKDISVDEIYSISPDIPHIEIPLMKSVVSGDEKEIIGELLIEYLT